MLDEDASGANQRHLNDYCDVDQGQDGHNKDHKVAKGCSSVQLGRASEGHHQHQNQVEAYLIEEVLEVDQIFLPRLVINQDDQVGYHSDDEERYAWQRPIVQVHEGECEYDPAHTEQDWMGHRRETFWIHL